MNRSTTKNTLHKQCETITTLREKTVSYFTSQ
jgi:hypothetical protein